MSRRDAAHLLGQEGQTQVESMGGAVECAVFRMDPVRSHIGDEKLIGHHHCIVIYACSNEYFDMHGVCTPYFVILTFGGTTIYIPIRDPLI